MSTGVPLEVDVTGWLLTQLASLPMSTETPADLVGSLPYVRASRVGGPDDGFSFDIPTVVFDCFAADQHSANLLAISVGRALRALRGVPVGGAVLTQVRKLSGPFEATYENDNVRRALLTYQLHVRAA